MSSAFASILVGKYAPIDFSDGSGMNLLDIRTGDWNALALKSTAKNLKKKLGAPSPSYTPLGNISPYFVQRYGFKKYCTVITWSGDNPCSLAGLGL